MLDKKRFRLHPILLQRAYAEDWRYCLGPSQPIQLMGHGQGIEKEMKDRLAGWGPRVERVTSSSKARLYFNCKGKETWRGAFLCPPGTCFPTRAGEQKPAECYQEWCPSPCKDPKCLSFQWSAASSYHCRPRLSVPLPHPFSLGMTSSLEQQSGSARKWEIYSENCHFPRFSPPTSILFPKVCSPVTCQVDDSNSQMCHAQLVNNRLSNRAINLLARWLLCRSAMPQHSPTNSVWWVRLAAAPCSPGTGIKV